MVGMQPEPKLQELSFSGIYKNKIIYSNTIGNREEYFG